LFSFFEKFIKIPSLSMLHYYAHAFILDKRLNVLDDIVMVKLLHHFYLFYDLLF